MGGAEKVPLTMPLTPMATMHMTSSEPYRNNITGHLRQRAEHIGTAAVSMVGSHRRTGGSSANVKFQSPPTTTACVSTEFSVRAAPCCNGLSKFTNQLEPSSTMILNRSC